MAHDVFFGGDRTGLIEEVRLLVPDMASSFDHGFLGRVYGDVILLFDGKYPGYQASNTRYHNIAHTLSVFLATARLLHGTHVRGRRFTTQNLLLGMIAALFHDVGLIQEEGDTKGSGAKYTIGHEERSIEFMKVYLSEKDFSSEDITDCSHFIMSTILALPPKEIPFRSEETETVGHIVGSADLLAQMADRLYLEKLLLLFEEFEEARLPGFDTELTLLKKKQKTFTGRSQKNGWRRTWGVCTRQWPITFRADGT